MNILHKNSIFGIIDAFSRLPQIIAVVYLARLLGPELFGVWVLIQLTQLLISGISGLGLSTALSRFAPSSSLNDAKGMLLISISAISLIFIILLIITSLSYNIISSFLLLDDQLKIILIPVIILSYATTLEGMLDAFFKSRSLLRMHFIFISGRTLIELMAILIVFNLIFSYLTESKILIVYIALIAISRSILYIILLSKATSGFNYPKLIIIRMMLGIGGAMLVTFILSWISVNVERIIVLKYLSSYDLGVYGFGSVIASYTAYVSYMVYPLMQARAIIAFDNNDLNKLKYLFKEIQLLYTLVMLPLVLFLSLFSNEIITASSGENFLTAAPVIIFLAFAICIDHISILYEWVYMMNKKTSLIALVALINAILRVGFFSYFLINFNLYYAIMTIPIVSFLIAILRYILAKNYINFEFPKIMFLAIFTSLIFILISMYLQDVTFFVRGVVYLLLGLPFIIIFVHKIISDRWLVFSP